MSQSEDNAFIRKFSGIIIGLILLTVALIFLARSLQFEGDADANPSRQILLEERVAPVASVRVGDEGAAQLAETQSAAAPAESGPADVDGEQVYGGLCKTCHDAGVLGAPIAGSEQMSQRVTEKGLDTVVSNAINGINNMPARGGNPGLTDEQIKAAIEFMLP